MPTSRTRARQSALRDRLRSLRREIRERERRVDLSGFGDAWNSARNLLHYLALRRVDLRPVQRELADLGLSSLGRAEGHTLHNLDAVLAHLATGRSGESRGGPTGGWLTPENARRILASRARALFGDPPPGRATRIMVTLPEEAAKDGRLVRDLLAAGMDVARVNCAHDNEAAWAAMLRNVRRATRAIGRSCRVEMDLGGPKLRTGPLAPGPAVVKVRPVRDLYGRVVRPSRIALYSSSHPAPRRVGWDAVIPVDPLWPSVVRVPGVAELTDTRGAPRALQLVRRRGRVIEARASQTIYFAPSTVIVGYDVRKRRQSTRVGALPHREVAIGLRPGDRLWLSARPIAGRPLRRSGRDPHRPVGEISCTLPGALDALQVGDPVLFDDGKIQGAVEEKRTDGVVVRVSLTAPGGAKLRADRGINVPGRPVPGPSLTEEDRSHLTFVAAHADLIGASFLRSAADVAHLRSELARLGHPHRAIILKIETQEAFDQLPAILLEGLRDRPVGVMIARGDLALEVGYARLAEVQEEILWLCEAAHLPTIWATEVLAGLTKTGIPSRAEVTDAAMGERAECVMLNKGPHIVEAVRALDNILRRMAAHQEKKSARLRHLAIAERFFESEGRTGAGALRTPASPA